MTDATRWLNEREARIWRSFITSSALIMGQLSESMKERTGLTMDDYEVLVHLSESDPQRLRMSELSRRLLHSQSRLTQRVDRLAKRGLVGRERCPEDGRGMFAVLTPEGLACITEMAPDHVNDVRQLLIDRIEPDEQDLVLEVFERLAKAAREDAES